MNSSRIRSKMITFASTAMPSVSTRPAMPGIVRTGSWIDPVAPIEASFANTPRMFATITSAAGRSATSRNSAMSATRPAYQ